MYINFTDIVNRYVKPKGIIHIGAHLLEEREEYLKHNLSNTIWVEANPKIYNQISGLDKPEIVLNYAVSDIDDAIYTFNITNNGQSSSILDLDLHSQYHPHIFVTETIDVKSKRMDTIIDEYSININDYDFLNIDIQGAELLAIKSFGHLISNFKFIYTEVNTNYLYKDCALISEIDEYLGKFNFKRLETVMTDAEWGDALYVRDDIKPKMNLIFDIGGHVGLFTEECLNKYPDSKIVVIEANKDLYSNLHLKYNENPKVVALNYLVSETTGNIENFYLCDYSQISTASIDWIQNSRFNSHNFYTSVGVMTVNLDSLIKIFGKPDLIKIDVEGYELEVISGLSQKVGEICFEWAEEQYDKINETCQKLKSLGYNNFGYIIGDDFLKKPDFYTSWEGSDFHQIVNPNQKDKWGMIWVN